MAPPLTTTLIDDFNRANGAIGAAYTALGGGFNVASNQIVGTGTGVNYVYRNNITSPADCESRITVATLPTNNQGASLMLRFSGATVNGYMLTVYNNGANYTWYIYRVIGGTPSLIGTSVTGQTMAAGDQIGFQAVGSTLIGYRYTGGVWTEIINRTDSTYATGAYYGFYTDGTTARLDDFYGGAATIGGVQSATFAAMTSSATGAVSSSGVNGTQSITFAAMTQGATGTVRVTGQQAATFAGMTQAATGTVAGGGINGTQSITFAAMTQTATGTAPPVTSIKFGIVGDSGLDEYRADDNRGGSYASVTYGSTELLVRVLGWNLGTWAARAEPRRTGYAQNWARSAATAGNVFNGTGGPSACAINQGQHTGLAAQVTAGDVDTCLIWLGSNDFMEHNGNFQDIYNGTVAGANLTAKINSIVTNIAAAADAQLNAGALRVLVANVFDIAPTLAASYPNATYRQRVSDAIAAVNSGVAALVAARAPQAALLDRSVYTPIDNAYPPDGNGAITINGQVITASYGDEPHNRILTDNHPGTVFSGIMANIFIIDRLNAAFNLSLARMSDSQITAQAGMGMAQIAGTQTITFAAMASTSAGTVLTHGAQAVSFASMTQAASGAVANRGAQSVTFAGITQSAAGTVANRGQQTITFGGITQSAAGIVRVSGQQAATLAGMVSSGAGTVLTHGAQSVTFAGTTSSAAGTVRVTGQQTVTFAGITSAASGVIGAPPNIGQQAATFAGMVQASAGTVRIAGQQTVTFAGMASTASGVVATHGAQTIGLADMTQTAAGAVSMSAQQMVTFAGMTQAAAGVVVGGSLAITGEQLVTFAAMACAAYGLAGMSLYRAAEDILYQTAIADLRAAENIRQQTNITGLRALEDLLASDQITDLRAAEDIV